jgi:hypothetical protein
MGKGLLNSKEWSMLASGRQRIFSRPITATYREFFSITPIQYMQNKEIRNFHKNQPPVDLAGA